MLKVNLEEIRGTVMLALPRAIIEKLHLGAGDAVDLVLSGGTLMTRAEANHIHSLDELLALSDAAAFDRTGQDLEWLASPPIGREEL